MYVYMYMLVTHSHSECCLTNGVYMLNWHIYTEFMNYWLVYVLFQGCCFYVCYLYRKFIYILRIIYNTEVSANLEMFLPFSKTLWLIKMTYHFSRYGFHKQILWWMTSHCFPIECILCISHKALPASKKQKQKQTRRLWKITHKNMCGE